MVLNKRISKGATASWCAIALLACAALVAATPAAEPELKVAVNETTIESFPVFAAAESLSATGNHQVKLLRAPNGRAAMAQLVSGEADAATGSETQALLGSVAEPRLRIVVTLSECRYRIIARRSAGIRRVADLRGKKVAATPNTSSQYYLAGMLRSAHLRETDVQLVPLEGQQMPAALKTGAVDAVAIWEPHAQNSLEAISSDVVAFEDPAVYTERFNLNTRTDVLSDPVRRAVLLRLLQAIDAASIRIRTRSAEMIPSLAPQVGLSEHTVSAVWRQFVFPASLSNKLGGSLNDVEPWVAATQGRQARTAAELANLIDRGVLKDARVR